jgi:hypothetical protein
MMREQQVNIGQEDNIAHEDNNYMSEEDFQANRHTYMLDGEKMVKIWSTFVI